MKIDLDEIQKEIIQNKINHGWPIDDINLEFNLLYGEVAEAFEAYNKKFAKEELGSELADVAIYLLGLADILGFSLQDEIQKKLEIIKHRKYVTVDGKTVKVDDRD